MRSPSRASLLPIQAGLVFAVLHLAGVIVSIVIAQQGEGRVGVFRMAGVASNRSALVTLVLLLIKLGSHLEPQLNLVRANPEVEFPDVTPTYSSKVPWM